MKWSTRPRSTAIAATRRRFCPAPSGTRRWPKRRQKIPRGLWISFSQARCDLYREGVCVCGCGNYALEQTTTKTRCPKLSRASSTLPPIMRACFYIHSGKCRS